MIPMSLLAGMTTLWLALWLAVRANDARVRVLTLTLEIVAGIVGKIVAFEFQEAYRMAWLTWRLFRLDKAQLTCVAAAVEAKQARALR